MVTGRGVFARKSAADTLAAILGDEPKPLSRLAPDVPAELQRIVTQDPAKEKIRALSNGEGSAGRPARSEAGTGVSG